MRVREVHRRTAQLSDLCEYMGKFDKNSFKVSSGLNGVGSTVVNALSESFIVTSFRGKKEYSLEFAAGRKVADFSTKNKRKDFEAASGTLVSFIPDKTILGKYSKLVASKIQESLKLRSYINAGLKFVYNDKTEFYHPNGIKEMIGDLHDDLLTEVFYFQDAEPALGNLYEIAFAYSKTGDEDIHSFANGISTTKGTHESGFRKGVTDAIKGFINEQNLLPKRGVKLKDISGEDVRSGLVAVVNIRYANAAYSAQTKDELTNPELFGKISSLTREEITKITATAKDTFKTIGTRVVQFTRGRLRASSYKEAVIKVDNKSMGLVDNGKFVDCYGTDVGKREILIIEGDSASGSIKQGRDPQWQAVFPLRGKILNTNGMQPGRVIQNAEINTLLLALFGSNDLRKIDQTKDLRFSKIIMTSDSDDDGERI